MVDDPTLRRIVENPFFVLGIPVSASRAEVEREGAKLLSMLELDMPPSRVYSSPVGPRARSPDLIRVSMAELRDPDRRIRHELWAAQFVLGEPLGRADAGEFVEGDDEAAPIDALAALGWKDP